MPKGQVAQPRSVICRACKTEFVTDRIGRQAWYCHSTKCDRQRARARRRQDAAYRAECRALERQALGADGRALARSVASRLQRAFVGYPAVVESLRTLAAAEGHAAKADAAHAVAVEALALEALMRRKAEAARPQPLDLAA